MGRAHYTAKGDRWSDDPDVKVREMRNAETVLGVMHRPLASCLRWKNFTSSSEGGGWKRTQPVIRKDIRNPA